jgi:hypothetical protein
LNTQGYKLPSSQFRAKHKFRACGVDAVTLRQEVSMTRVAMMFILTLVVPVFPMTGEQPRAAAQGKELPPSGKFTGVPRDVDFIKNAGWTQVIVTSRADDLISQTTNDRIVSVLLVALSLKREVVVDYVDDKNNPRKLTSVSLTVSPKKEMGQVLALSFDEKDSNCRATIFDGAKNVDVWTKSPVMQGILETAVRQSIPIQELMIGEKMEITRGKVNVEIR